MRFLLALPIALLAAAAGIVALPGCGCSDDARWGLSVTLSVAAPLTPRSRPSL